MNRPIVPDTTPFQITPARPVAGPGIDPLTVDEHVERREKVLSASDKSAPTARRQASRRKAKQTEVATSKQRTIPDVPSAPVSEPPDRRHTVVDLETVLSMLDMVKATERDHLKSILHSFNLLGPAGRIRVLGILNRMFR